MTRLFRDFITQKSEFYQGHRTHARQLYRVDPKTQIRKERIFWLKCWSMEFAGGLIRHDDEPRESVREHCPAINSRLADNFLHKPIIT